MPVVNRQALDGPPSGDARLRLLTDSAHAALLDGQALVFLGRDAVSGMREMLPLVLPHVLSLPLDVCVHLSPRIGFTIYTGYPT